MKIPSISPTAHASLLQCLLVVSLVEAACLAYEVYYQYGAFVLDGYDQILQWGIQRPDENAESMLLCLVKDIVWLVSSMFMMLVHN